MCASCTPACLVASRRGLAVAPVLRCAPGRAQRPGAPSPSPSGLTVPYGDCRRRRQRHRSRPRRAGESEGGILRKKRGALETGRIRTKDDVCHLTIARPGCGLRCGPRRGPQCSSTSRPSRTGATQRGSTGGHCGGGRTRSDETRHPPSSRKGAAIAVLGIPLHSLPLRGDAQRGRGPYMPQPRPLAGSPAPQKQ